MRHFSHRPIYVATELHAQLKKQAPL